jgi:hypothetical protein
VSTATATRTTRPGRCALRGPITASERRVLRRTRCRASVQVRTGEGWVRVGGSRFLQTDPIPGGSANDYDYAGQDPINAFDLDGRMLVPISGDSPSCAELKRQLRELYHHYRRRIHEYNEDVHQLPPLGRRRHISRINDVVRKINQKLQEYWECCMNLPRRDAPQFREFHGTPVIIPEYEIEHLPRDPFGCFPFM